MCLVVGLIKINCKLVFNNKVLLVIVEIKVFNLVFFVVNCLIFCFL